MKSSTKNAFIVNLKTSVTIKQVIVNTKRKRFKKDIRPYSFFNNKHCVYTKIFFQFIGQIISNRNTRHLYIYQIYPHLTQSRMVQSLNKLLIFTRYLIK